MQANIIMVRYGELSTKGKNKKDFIKLLGTNIKHALKKFNNVKVEVKHDHTYVHLNGDNYEDVKNRLLDVSGIYSLSPVYKVENDIDVISNLCLELAKNQNKNTFKIDSRRADKTFNMVSSEINRYVAGNILRNTNYKVDVHHPELLISIVVREKETYIFSETILASGGYPLGIAGKSLMMLSGGIDSPVAAYLMMKRGIKLECIHFASPPYTNQAVITKIKDLLNVLNNYQEEIKLYIVPFTHLQEEIYRNVPVSYAITIMRRMMYRIACIVANRNKDLVISNGESIGQVASQTLKSIKIIEQVSTLPVIRPLAIYDKVDIISIARKIGTFDISIRPYEDCCTIFEVKDPTTAPNEEKVIEYEGKFDYQSLVEECANNLEVVKISLQEDKEIEDLL